ncbi:MAG TPA: MFS transporter [Pseudonocardia sp.]|nr:MFS transporter [Pseudonocardia sp.]
MSPTRHTTAALVAVCLGYFMIILDATIVNAALPALRADLRVGPTGPRWVVDGYLVMLAALLLSGGALADRFGARRVGQLGLGVFVVASVGCGLAPDLATLVLARLVQGVGAAAAVPATLALLRAAFPEPAARARVFGVWGGIAGVAAAAGPIVGGVLVSVASWRLVFLVNLPIGLLAMGLTARYVPAPPPRPRRLDPAAQVLAVLALAGLTVALIEGGWVAGAGALVFLAATPAFLLVERRVVDPMLPLALFRNTAFAGGTVIGLLLNLGFYGELFVLNLYFQQGLGYSALLAGLALLPQMGVVALGSALSGRCTARAASVRPTLLIGLAVGGAGLFGLALAGAHTPYPVLVVPLVAAGFGMSFSMPAVTTAVVEAAPAERAGLAAGAINAARQVGGVLGVALLGGLAGAGVGLGLRLAVVLAGAVFWLAAAVAAHSIPGRAEQR